MRRRRAPDIAHETAAVRAGPQIRVAALDRTIAEKSSPDGKNLVVVWRSWIARGSDGLLPDDFVTWVNLSAKQLNAGGIVPSVERALEAAALPPYRLGLEVTETAVVAEGPSGERARDELHELHERGVRIAIDDFGTGFSSIANLRRFPVDVIKVDRSFIQGADSDAKDAAITSNIAGLAHALGLRAVAEGVECSEQLGSALKFGCDVAQGFLFARPVPAAEMRDVLVEHGSADAAAGLRASA